ncbi:MAG: hypothetical protein IJA02_00475 [Clostridia bacterium]|nr:hypothetical protein [Clostridia bacterium]
MSKTKTTKKFKLNPLAIVALVLCALVAVYCGTTAWITSGAPINPWHLTQLDDFHFTVTPSSSNGVLTYTFTKNNVDISQLSGLSFTVEKTGNGVPFVRFRVSHEWTAVDANGDTVRLQGEYNLPFKLGTDGKLYDNRSADGFVYYAGSFPTGEDEKVEVFSGFDTASFDMSAISVALDAGTYQSVTLKIDFTVDAVQFNRYRQVWGMNTLPWRS